MANIQRDWKTRVVRGGFPDREFDIEFWQLQGDEAIFEYADETVATTEAFAAIGQHQGVAAAIEAGKSRVVERVRQQLQVRGAGIGGEFLDAAGEGIVAVGAGRTREL